MAGHCRASASGSNAAAERLFRPGARGGRQQQLMAPSPPEAALLTARCAPSRHPSPPPLRGTCEAGILHQYLLVASSAMHNVEPFNLTLCSR